MSVTFLPAPRLFTLHWGAKKDKTYMNTKDKTYINTKAQRHKK